MADLLALEALNYLVLNILETFFQHMMLKMKRYVD